MGPLTSPAAPPLACCLGLCILLAPVPALAQEDPSQEAKALYLKGQERFKAEEHMEAATLFEQSYALSLRPEMLYYIGLAYEKGGALLRAQSAYQRYLEALPEAKDAEAVLGAVLTLQERIAAEMGRVDVVQKATKGHLFVDDEATPRCKDSCLVALKPGDHLLTLRTPTGALVESFSLSVKAGDEKSILLEKRLDALGTVLISSSAQGELSLEVDGSLMRIPADGKVPLPVADQAAVTLRLGSTTVWQGTLEIQENQTTTLVVAQAPGGGNAGHAGPSSWRQPAGLGLLGAGLGLLAGGVLMGLESQSTFDTLSARQAQGLPPQPTLIDQGSGQQTLANILLLGGGLSLVGGGVLLVWDAMTDDPDPAPTARLP